jgi:hypothetical protein
MTKKIHVGLFRARKNYDESDNVFVSYSRAFTDRVADTFGMYIKCWKPNW